MVLVFEKKFKVWCACVLKGDPEIDVAKIDAALLDGSDLTYEQQTQVHYSLLLSTLYFLSSFQLIHCHFTVTVRFNKCTKMLIKISSEEMK